MSAAHQPNEPAAGQRKRALEAADGAATGPNDKVPRNGAPASAEFAAAARGAAAAAAASGVTVKRDVGASSSADPARSAAAAAPAAPAPAPWVPPATVLPSCAAWFDPGAVHINERRALPDFFDGSSALRTERSYVEARNFIITAHRQQPSLYLSLTEVRRHLTIDVGAATRLHRFLEHWGIINYVPAPALAAAAAHPRLAGSLLLDGPAPAVTAAAALVQSRHSLPARPAVYQASGPAWSDSDTLALLEALGRNAYTMHASVI